MKTIHKILYFALLTVILAASCRKDTDTDYIPDEQPAYEVVPYSITVSLVPMDDKIDGVELKTAFDAGDQIKITNPKILYAPSTLTSSDCNGKSTAVFSGELKIRAGATIDGVKLTAALTTADTSLHLYNDGKPFVDVKEIESFEYGLDKYSYWSCENFTYNAAATSIQLEQKTIFARVDMPFSKADFLMTLGNAFCNITFHGGDLFAFTFGTRIENEFLGVDETLDEEGKFFYDICSDAMSNCFIMKPFSLRDGTMVYFTRGNLQFNVYDEKWRLAPTQYHICFDMPIPDGYLDIGDGYEAMPDGYEWTDLFGWGTWLPGRFPIMTSTYDEDYDYEEMELAGFGHYGEEWTVLSAIDWYYIFDERPDAYDKMGFANILGVEGMVLLPDDWTQPEGIFFDTFDVNEYSMEEWDAMEAEGAVFLPMTGMRYGTEIWKSDDGNYWMSGNPPVLRFGAYWLYGFESTNVFFGNAVRLVYKEETPASEL